MVDNRPKPKYGELAPEGWVWKPPVPPESADVPVPAATPGGSEGSRTTGGGPAVPPPYSGPARWSTPPSSQAPAPYRGTPAPGPQGIRAGDAVATGLLLFLGILLSASMIPALFDFNSVLAQAAAMQGYDSFSPAAATQNVGVVAGVATVILNLASIVLSVRRVQRHRIAFYMPLIFGAVTFIVWTSAITFAYFSDPSFLQNLTTPTPSVAP